MVSRPEAHSRGSLTERGRGPQPRKELKGKCDRLTYQIQETEDCDLITLMYSNLTTCSTLQLRMLQCGNLHPPVRREAF